MQYFLKSQVNKGWRFCLIGSFSLRWPRLRFHYFPEKLARFRIRLTSFSFFLRSQVNKYGHFCLIGSFSLRCASTSFSRFARRISTISHSPNLCFPSFEVKIFSVNLKGGDFIYPMMHRFILYYQASERTWSYQFSWVQQGRDSWTTVKSDLFCR